MTAVSRNQRFSKSDPCPICGGFDGAVRGRGVRCFGFRSDDGLYVHCTREDHAGALRAHPGSQTYAHRLAGACLCGSRHGAAIEQTDSRRALVAEYDYTNASGKLLYQVCRYEPKTFRQRRPDGAGGWVWNLRGVERVLYRLPEVLESAIVFLVEGEKDCESLRDWGLPATTTVGGANAPWLPQFTDSLRGREVIIVPDLDDPGIAWAKRIGRELCGNVARLAVHLLRDEVNGNRVKDVSDFFEYGGSEVELIENIWGAHETRANA